MKYLIDAQLPKRLSFHLQNMDLDTRHTLDLPDENRTKDQMINSISVDEKRIVISKDYDFIDSILISEKPFKLLYVATGNITNQKLLELFSKNIQELDKHFETYRFIELTSESYIIHQ